jgi:hypothetical protein
VQGTLSLQLVSTGVEEHPTPGWHTSLVQPTPSSHWALSAKLLQTPFAVLQVSVVHETPSAQSLSWVQPVPHSPPLHMPALPAPSVQAVPSTAVVAEQPSRPQMSTVHSFPSSQTASSKTWALQMPVVTSHVLVVQVNSSAQSWSAKQPLEHTPAVQVPLAPPESVHTVPSARSVLSHPVSVQLDA